MLRGDFRSRSIESLVEEAKYLVANGAREIILISQDSTYYGLDIYGRMALADLLRALHEIEGLHWIRIMYFYPSETNIELLKTIAELPKVVKYVDIPLQHSHPEVLSQMARPKKPEAVIEAIRKYIPDVAIRSTFIVGFPGETDEQFEHLHQFIGEQKLNRLGVFTYSKQTEVPSGNMPNQLPEKTKKARRKRLMELQHGISTESNQKLVGRTIEVLIEGFDENKGLYVGRSQWDAPQVDNQVYVKDLEGDIVIGDFVQVKIEEARPYDLIGVTLPSLPSWQLLHSGGKLVR